jgi:hypothetical protein
MQAVLPLSPLLRIAGGPGQPKARGLWPSGASFRSDRQATTVTSLRPYDTVVPTLLFTVEGENLGHVASLAPSSSLFIPTQRFPILNPEAKGGPSDMTNVASLYGGPPFSSLDT